ncbi:MAG: AraC family transcriptional regulator ligand-binding domain-containing protein [Hyphomicrobiaceae bacterium]
MKIQGGVVLREPRLRASFLSPMRDYLRVCSADATQTFRRAGFANDLINEPCATLQLNAIAELFEIASQETKNPYFGLHFADWLQAGHLGLMDHLMLTARSVNDGLQLIAKYEEATLTQLQLSCRVGNRYTMLSGQFPPAFVAPPGQFVDFFVASLLARIRMAAGGDWRADRLALPRGEPTDVTEYNDRLGRSVTFETSTFHFSVHQDVAQLPMPAAWPMLSETVVAAAEKTISAAHDERSVVGQVASILIANLRSGDQVKLTSVASSLGLSPRALQWRLETQQTTFDAVLTEVRKRLVINLLRDSSKPLNVISREIGFSESSAFTRWSKQAFGMSPSAFRSHLRAPVGSTISLYGAH